MAPSKGLSYFGGATILQNGSGSFIFIEIRLQTAPPSKPAVWSAIWYGSSESAGAGARADEKSYQTGPILKHITREPHTYKHVLIGTI